MDNRTQILEVALDLFADRGYESVGVQAIAEAARVTKPTLYHYFGSKKGLLEALLELHFQRLNSVVQEAAHYEGDLPLTLNRVVRACFSFGQAEPDFYRFQLSLHFGPPHSEAVEVVTALANVQYEILEAMFRQAEEDHGNMRGRSRAYAATLLGMINTYFLIGTRGEAELDADQAFRAVHQFMHGIFS